MTAPNDMSEADLVRRDKELTALLDKVAAGLDAIVEATPLNASDWGPHPDLNDWATSMRTLTSFAYTMVPRGRDDG